MCFFNIAQFFPVFAVPVLTLLKHVSGIKFRMSISFSKDILQRTFDVLSLYYFKSNTGFKAFSNNYILFLLTLYTASHLFLYFKWQNVVVISMYSNGIITGNGLTCGKGIHSDILHWVQFWKIDAQI